VVGDVTRPPTSSQHRIARCSPLLAPRSLARLGKCLHVLFVCPVHLSSSRALGGGDLRAPSRPARRNGTERFFFVVVWWDGPRGPKNTPRTRAGWRRRIPLMCRFFAVAAYRCRISPVNLWCGRSRLRGGGGARSLLAGDVTGGEAFLFFWVTCRVGEW
jgi:hypothetical protein